MDWHLQCREDLTRGFQVTLRVTDSCFVLCQLCQGKMSAADLERRGNGREDFKGLFVVYARGGCGAPPLLDLPQYPVRPPAAKRVQKVLRTLQRTRCQLLRTAEVARSDASRAQIGGKVQFMLVRLEPGKVVN